MSARDRVLVLKDTSAPKSKVLAICLEQNLVGRGGTPEESLEDLAEVLLESLKYELQAAVPASQPDPDPRLLRVFESKAKRTETGELVLQRLWVSVCMSLVEEPKKTKLVSHRGVTYEPCLAPAVMSDGRS